MTERYEDGFDRFFAERDAREATYRVRREAYQGGEDTDGFRPSPEVAAWDRTLAEARHPTAKVPWWKPDISSGDVKTVGWHALLQLLLKFLR